MTRQALPRRECSGPHCSRGTSETRTGRTEQVIWVERRELQPFNPCLYCCHLARVAYDPRSCPHAHAGMSRLGQECFRSSVFKSRRRPSVRWHATVCVPGRGDPLCGPVCIPGGLYASVCIRGCIHLFFPIRLVSDVPGWPPHVYALYASFPYRGFGKRKETPYIDAYNAYKRKELCFFLYL